MEGESEVEKERERRGGRERVGRENEIEKERKRDVLTVKISSPEK